MKSPRKGGKGTFSDVLGCLQTNHLKSKTNKNKYGNTYLFKTKWQLNKKKIYYFNEIE